MNNNGDRIIKSAYMKYWCKTSDLAFIKDINGVYIASSHAFAEMAGQPSPAQLIGKTDFEIFADHELAKRYMDDDARLLASGISLENYIEPITSKGERPRYSLTSKYILADENGKAVGIYGTGRDITVEYEAIQSYESELKSLFELPPDALAAVLFDITSWRVVDMRHRDNTNHIVSHYSYIDEFFANAAESVVNDAEVRGFFEGLTQEYIQKEYAGGMRRFSLEYIRRFPDGAEKWVRDELRLLLDPVNSNLSLIIILHDIDRTKLEYTKLVLAAERDSMTGLLNHDATIKCINRSLENASGIYALFMIDLDSFKSVNDTFGHKYGDSVIKDAARAVANSFGGDDIVGRLGGDEFMVLMKNASSKENVINKASELLSVLQFTSCGNNKTLELTASLGVVVFTDKLTDFNVLYTEADSALYQAKRDGKNRYCIREPELLAKKEAAASPMIENVSTVQLRTLLDYMDGGVIMLEVSGKIHITYISPSLYSSFGRTPPKDESGEQELVKYVQAEELLPLKEAILKAADSNDLVEHSFRVVCDGKIQWRHIRIKRIPESCDTTHRLVAVVTDISNLKRSTEMLLEAEKRYRAAAEQTNAMLWEVAPDTGMLTLVGSAWEALGISEKVYYDAPESYLASGRVHPDSFEELRKMFADIYALNDKKSYYFKVYDQSGNESWVKANFKLLYDDSSKPQCALGITIPMPNINAEMRTFEQEIRFAETVSKTLSGCLRANLTQNVLEHIKAEHNPQNERLAGVSYDEFLHGVVRSFIAPEDYKPLVELVSRESLTEKFRRGESWHFSEYKRITPDGKQCRMSLLIKLMRHPISGELYAFGYLRSSELSHRWEQSLSSAVLRDSASLLYSQKSLRALGEYILSECPSDNLVSVSVIELECTNQTGDKLALEKQNELLTVFGRLCWMVISADSAIGQLDENHIAVLRADVDSLSSHSRRVTDTMALLKKLMLRAYTEATVELAAGYAAERAGGTTYDTLLKKALLACRSAAEAIGESAVAYSEIGSALSGDEAAEGLYEKYHALLLRFRQQAKMLRISENDELTGIWAKQAFCRHTREYLTSNPDSRAALVRFDINRFKVYNDVCGTAAGDKLLYDIAQMLKGGSSPAIYAARLESDHFVMLVRDDSEAIRDFTDALAKWLGEYSRDFRLSASVGVYIIVDASLDVALMCDRTLLALRSVKTGFDTRLAYYGDELRDRLLDEQQLVSDIEAALEGEQFVIYFQPQINYESGRLIGSEALVRWQHPTRGLLLPSEFIPLFEKNGMISRLDKYVWERCCRYIRRWSDKNPDAEMLSISVNMSRLDIYDPDLCETLTEIVNRYSLPTSALKLEITESAYMENPEQLIAMMRELQNAGFLVEMDDFGSGYSSLNTLKDVAVDILKLDMSFLEECKNNARGGNILNSIIRMAHWLKLPIIAEGVETKSQADYLKSLGCIYMQGYFFDRPMPADDFAKLFEKLSVAKADKYLKTNIEGMAAFWDSSAQTALMFNSFIGGAAIMEYRDGVLEASRVNDNFYKTLGTTRETFLPMHTDIFSCIDYEDKGELLRTLESAIESGEEQSYEIKTLFGAGGITALWISCRIRLLAKNYDSAILYVSIEDVTARKRLELERELESKRIHMLMETTGISLFEYDLASDLFSYQVYMPDYGIVKHDIPNYYKNLDQSGFLDRESKKAVRAVIDNAAEMPSGEIEYRCDIWSSGMRWCRARYVGIRDEGGRVYRFVGQIDDIQEAKNRRALSAAISYRTGTASLYAFHDEIVNQITGLFYSSSDTDGAISTTLALLGEYYGLSRTYIFEDSSDHTSCSNTYEWCSPDIDPGKHKHQRLSYNAVGGWEKYVSLFGKNGTFYCNDIKSLSPEMQKALKHRKPSVVLQCAIMDNGVFSGMIGFDDCRAGAHWSDEQVGTLLFAARIVGAFLLKMRLAEG